jgi:hypothetical protein
MARYRPAITQIRYRRSDGRAYYEKKITEGKTHKEALRSLKRRISDAIYAALLADARQEAAAAACPEGPGGQPGNRSVSRAAGSHPATPALRTSHSRACHHPTARRYRKSRRDSAESSASAPGWVLPGQFKETPDNRLTPTAKRTRSARQLLLGSASAALSRSG